jgi:hypothetical protein
MAGQPDIPAWAYWVLVPVAFGLMGLALQHRGLASGNDLHALSIYVEPDELYGRQWLLCYEASRRGWLTSPSGRDALSIPGPLRYLAERNVSFFDPTQLQEEAEIEGEQIAEADEDSDGYF